MKAIQLTGLEGFDSLRLVEIDRPKPAVNEILVEIRAAGINFAELEMTKGRYQASQKLPFTMGFEGAGVVVEAGSEAKHLRIGDKVTTIVSSGSYAEYATANASFAIPIPGGISFAEATAIPVQGLSAHALLTLAAKPQPHESVLIQSAAGGVGVFLVQLAKLMGVNKVIALAGSREKLDLVKELGADVVINYNEENWAARVREATQGKGVDVVLESASGRIGEESFKLLAPFGRIVLFGAQNAHDTLSNERVRQLIFQNQSVTGFNFPSLRPEQIGVSVAALLEFIGKGKLRLFANHTFPLTDVKKAFQTISERQTTGKVVLVP